MVHAAAVRVTIAGGVLGLHVPGRVQRFGGQADIYLFAIANFLSDRLGEGHFLLEEHPTPLRAPALLHRRVQHVGTHERVAVVHRYVHAIDSLSAATPREALDLDRHFLFVNSQYIAGARDLRA